MIWFSGENYAKLKDQTISNLSLPKLIETVDLTNKSFLNVKIEDEYKRLDKLYSSSLDQFSQDFKEKIIGLWVLT